MGLAAEGLGARSASSLPFEASSGMPTVRLTSPCCPPGAVEEEPKTLERSIEARLDKLSEQMDAVLAEVMGLKNSTPPSGPDVKALFRLALRSGWSAPRAAGHRGLAYPQGAPGPAHLAAERGLAALPQLAPLHPFGPDGGDGDEHLGRPRASQGHIAHRPQRAEHPSGGPKVHGPRDCLEVGSRALELQN